MAKPPAKTNAPAPEEPLNWYGLPALGYGPGSLPLTGVRTTDQLLIESICHRIALQPHEGGLGAFGHFMNYVNLLWNNPELKSAKRYVPNAWGDRMLEEACGEFTPRPQLGVAGPTSAGKSDPFALYAVTKYLMDPTHTLVMVMSTTIGGAKKRIWKTLKEYWMAIPNAPGRPLWSSNEIKGVSYDGKTFGDSSGIYLLASEQSNEKAALDKLIGIKAPRTGEPDESFESLYRDPAYADLVRIHSKETLRSLLPRLARLSDDRIGTLILIIDEATGCTGSILNVIRSNLMPGNVGHFQVIMLGNPNSHFDTFGLFCAPKGGWGLKTVDDEEWETDAGGFVIRFNGEHNPRITEGNDKFSWMLRKEELDNMARDYGRDSLYYYRMALGMWYPKGVEAGIYSEADMVAASALGVPTWGFNKPEVFSTLDPSFTQGGDRAMATFFAYGTNDAGVQVLQRTEAIAIKVDMENTDTPISHQIVRKWRRECQMRGIPAYNAACDITGAPSFGDIVRVEWSPQVMLVNSGGKPPKTPWGREKDADGNPVLASDKFHNKATYIWFGAMPFLRSHQLWGISADLAKEICSRQHAKTTGNDTGRKERIEDKRVYKAREGHSPDESDSYFLGIELARVRFGFKPNERSAVDPDAPAHKKVGTWKQFVEKARRGHKTIRNLQNGKKG